jgi:HEAT repeat protein
VKTRLFALLAIVGFGAAVGILVWWLNSQSPVYQGKPVKTWLLQLSRPPDPQARDEAEAALKAIGTNAVPELARLLRADDARWRKLIWRHASLLPRPVGGMILQRIDPLQAYLIRPAAARALGKLGPGAAAATPDLVRALRDRLNGTSGEAGGALRQIGRPAVPDLIGALRDEDKFVRATAAGALGQIGPEAAPAIPALIQILTRSGPDEQQFAAQNLARIGTPAVAALINVLVRQGGTAGEAAASALLAHYGRPGPPLSAGKDLSGDDTAAARQQAFEMLGASGLPDELVTRLLFGAVRDPAPGVRLAALKALAQGNGNPQPALPSLVAGLRDESPAIREWSARALVKIGPRAKPAIPALTRLAQDKEESVRTAALDALAAINPPGKTNTPMPLR